MSDFITKDSGKRDEFESGMKRDTQEGKARYDLVDWDMVERWAELMARGAQKYGEENWRLAAGEAELKRFKASALRHCIQWFRGETDEDHGAATFFNIAGAEMVKEKTKYQTPLEVDFDFKEPHPVSSDCVNCVIAQADPRECPACGTIDCEYRGNGLPIF